MALKEEAKRAVRANPPTPLRLRSVGISKPSRSSSASDLSEIVGDLRQCLSLKPEEVEDILYTRGRGRGGRGRGDYHLMKDVDVRVAYKQVRDGAVVPFGFKQRACLEAYLRILRMEDYQDTDVNHAVAIYYRAVIAGVSVHVDEMVRNHCVQRGWILSQLFTRVLERARLLSVPI